jgi:muconolactone delta-isomerase
MRYLVSINFIQGQEAARAALLHAEQAHVRALMEQGTVEAGYLSADRTRSWMVLRGESQDHVEQTMASLPFYPFMELEFTPLLDLRPGAAGAVAPQSPVAP